MKQEVTRITCRVGRAFQVHWFWNCHVQVKGVHRSQVQVQVLVHGSHSQFNCHPKSISLKQFTTSWEEYIFKWNTKNHTFYKCLWCHTKSKTSLQKQSEHSDVHCSQSQPADDFKSILLALHLRKTMFDSRVWRWFNRRRTRCRHAFQRNTS